MVLQDDIDYLEEEILDHHDLLWELPAEHKWGQQEVQTALKTMTGVSVEEINQVEELFHVDVFMLKNIPYRKGKNKTYANVVRLSDKQSDQSVNLLVYLNETDMPHFLLVKDTKKLLNKLICEHCESTI